MVKAFNTAFASRQADPADVGSPRVMGRAWRRWRCCIMLQIRNTWPWQAGFKLVGPTS